MAEEVENNANEEDVDNSEVAKLYRRLFDSFQEYLNNGGHAYVLDDSGYFDQFGFDAGDRKHAEELNSYANRKAIESVKKAGQQKTPEVTFAEDTLLRIRHFEKWDNQRLRDSGVYNQEKDAWKIYSWDNEEQRAKDIEIERQKREAEWQKEEVERQRREAEWQKRIEAERQKKEAEDAEKERIEAERQKIEKENKEKTKLNNNAIEENSGGQNMNTEDKKTEPKTEIKVKPEAEAKDFDFEAFLAQVGKENPDMSVIKAGVEKFGMGMLSDTQKEQFLKTVFPEGNQQLSLGFENMQGIVNTMAALEDLSRNGKLEPEQVKGVLQAENPYNKRNMVSTLALNIRAGEFKAPYMSNEKDRKIIGDNVEAAELALDFLSKLDKDIVRDVVNTPDNSDKKFSLAKLAASGKSEILSKFMDNNLSQNTQSDNAIDIDGQNTTVVGGDNGITVNEAPKKAMNVNAPKNEEDDEEKTADMSPNAGDDKKKRRPFDFEKVKEQDIIQYMFENWFLEGVTLALKAPFWVMNKCLDALDGKFDSSMPKAPLKTGEGEKNKQAIDFLNDRGGKVASACMGGIETQRSYYNNLYETVSGNIGKKPEDWKIAQFGGKPIVNTARITDLNRMYEKLPDFKDRLSKLKDMSSEDFKVINKYMQIGGRLAVSQYMAANLDGPFDDSVDAQLKQMALDTTKNILSTIKQINDRIEFNYRAEQGIAPDQPLTDAQKQEVEKAATPVVKQFVEDMTNAGADLRKSINEYHQRGTKSEKEVKGKAVKINAANLSRVWGDEYLSSICPSKMNEKANGPISLYDLAQQEVQSSKLEKVFTDSLSRETAQLDGAKQEVEERKQAYKNNPKYQRMKYAASRTSGKLGCTGVKIKETGKVVGSAAVQGAKNTLAKGGAAFNKMKEKVLGRKI